jgi:tRNA threonylcarbamoyladenosine biosynthesis protein TsaE
VQGLACGLGIDAAITSPTYTIFTIHRPSAAGAAAVHGSQFTVYGSQVPFESTPARERPTENCKLKTVNSGGGFAATLIHLDAYRLETPAQFDTLMLDDFLISPYILAVEWPEKIAAYIPKTAWRITLSILSPQTHLVRLESPTS